MSSPNQHYHAVAKTLHWLVAGMVILQFVLAKLAELADEAGSSVRELALLANHKSVGITILALVIVRLAWRQRHPPPPLPLSLPRWQVRASRFSHWLLYSLLFAMPVSGWLMSSASAYSVSWFNVLQLPDFVAPNPELKGCFLEIHELLAKLLFAVASVHILAALKHALIDKDDVMHRMLSTFSLAGFAIVVVGGALWLGTTRSLPLTKVDEVAVVAAPQAAEPEILFPAEMPEPGEPTQPAELPRWQIIPASSFIRFSGSQAGARFEGTWQAWHADLRFSAENLAGSSFEVTIETTSPETQDDDRDATLADAEWFDSARFPEAYYSATNFESRDGGEFVAHGQLTIKGRATPVPLQFNIAENGDARVLTGSASLDRLQLGVGTGEWQDTEWIGQYVTVTVRIEASVSP